LHPVDGSDQVAESGGGLFDRLPSWWRGWNDPRGGRVGSAVVVVGGGLVVVDGGSVVTGMPDVGGAEVVGAGEDMVSDTRLLRHGRGRRR
jgi:hypothetical protein